MTAQRASRRKNIFIVVLGVWALATTAGWYFEHKQSEKRLEAESDQFAKSLTASKEYETLQRFIDLFYQIDSSGAQSEPQGIEDYLSPDLVDAIVKRQRKTIEHFKSRGGQQSAEIFKILRDKNENVVLVYLELNQKFRNGETERLLAEVRVNLELDRTGGKDTQKLLISGWRETDLKQWPKIFETKLVSLGEKGSAVLRFPCQVVSTDTTNSGIKSQVNPREKEVQLFNSEGIKQPRQILASCGKERFKIDLFTDPTFETIFWKVSLKDAMTEPRPLTEREKLRKAMKEQLGVEMKD